jgi:hypothetical protein
MNWLGAAALTIGTTIIAVRIILLPWLTRQYKAGNISGRAAGWAYGIAAAAPYVFIALFLALTDVESLWIVVLLLAVTLPVMIIPYVAMFRYPRDK